jgi:hypothetical protein
VGSGFPFQAALSTSIPSAAQRNEEGDGEWVIGDGKEIYLIHRPSPIIHHPLQIISALAPPKLIIIPFLSSISPFWGIDFVSLPSVAFQLVINK